MDWDEIKETFGCLVYVLIIGAIIAVCTVGPGILNALDRWSDSL